MLGRIFKKQTSSEPPFAYSHEHLKRQEYGRMDLARVTRECEVRRKAEYYQENMGWDEEKAYRVADYVIEPWGASWVPR